MPASNKRCRKSDLPRLREWSAEYRDHLTGGGIDPGEVAARLDRLRRELRYLALTRKGRLRLHRMALWVSAQEPEKRRGRPPKAAVGAPGAGVEVRRFTAWAEATGKLPDPPREDRGRRYWFYPTDLMCFLRAVMESRQTLYGLTPHYRSMLYHTAVSTGLPPRALARLTAADCVFTGTGLRVAGVSVPGWTVGGFRNLIRSTPAGKPLWPSDEFARGRNAAAMLAADFHYAPYGTRLMKEGQRIGFDAFLMTRRNLILSKKFRIHTGTPGKPDRGNPDNETPHQKVKKLRRLVIETMKAVGLIVPERLPPDGACTT